MDRLGSGRRGRASAERQVPDRRIDALAVEVLVAIDERDAAQCRAGQRLQTMIDRGNRRQERLKPPARRSACGKATGGASERPLFSSAIEATRGG
jgi:hypothetical protein